VDHGGPDSPILTPAGPRNAADAQAGTSPDSRVINFDHDGTYNELGAVATNQACEIMSDD
jgi:hypothetical protein